jgi:uncharacterized integral membrane protein (TIGR00698 family)
VTDAVEPSTETPATTVEPPARVLPGLLLCALLGAAALLVAELPWVKTTLRVSALLLVILFGMAWKSLLPVPAAAMPGIRLAQRPLLRWAVAGLGFRLSLRELASIGGPALVVVVLATGSALFVGWWIARRLRVPEDLGLLLGVGGAICGASAIVAAETVVQGDRRHAPIALGVVTLLGTVGIVLYPLLARSLGMSDFVYGVFDGASLHEMAQVVAAGAGVSPEAQNVATVVKLARICLLAPVIVFLGWSLRHAHRAAGKAHVAPVPWFLVLFVAFAALRSTGWIPKDVIDAIVLADTWLLCVGMAGVGLQTGIPDLKSAGARPVVAAALQWLFLAVVAYALATALCA